LIWSNTGVITNRVRNSASPIRIWFDGVCWVPRPWRNSASTMMIRVNDVSMIRPAGSRLSSVIRIRICSVTE